MRQYRLRLLSLLFVIPRERFGLTNLVNGVLQSTISEPEEVELQTFTPMKFCSTLQFNAVPEWREHYIDYDQLKKLIFRLERADVPAFQPETSSLVGRDPEPVFRKALDDEVAKVDNFYRRREADVIDEVTNLEARVHQYLSEQTALFHDSEQAVADEDTQTAAAPLPVDANANDAASDSSDDEILPPRRRKSSIHEELVQKKSIPFENVSLRRDVTRLYVLLNELLSFIDLNHEGIRKALKKFDKVLGTTLLPEYMGELGTVHTFADSTTQLIGAHVDSLTASFAKLVGEPIVKAEHTLKGLLREHVVYERNTVWRELIGIERQAQGVQQPVEPTKSFGKIGRKSIRLIGITILFFLLLVIPTLSSPVQSRCLAMVVAASLLWATETIPLFVTSLLVPILVVLLRIPVNSDGVPMTAKEASGFIFAKMWSPVITVLLGGFTLAAALSKHNLAKALAQSILGRVGTGSPRKVGLVLMFLATFLCMWISNVAAPVLLFSVVQPILRLLPAGDPYSKSLILGIALASNIGGMASPIASPQNILALQNMEPVPSWGVWFVITLPISVISVLFIWMFLNLTLPISKEARSSMAHIRHPHPGTSFELSWVQIYVLFVTFLTIALWCFSHQLEPLTGDMGILALTPIVLLFGTGVLSAADFNNFLWTIVALAMGGIVLGQSVESCGLLSTAASYIQTKVQGLSLFSICIVFGLMVLVVASFISHTVAALIVLPLVKSVGEQLEDPHPRVIVMISALLCSAAMALPTSGFPNVTAVCMVDELGVPYLTAADFISRGVPASLITYLVVISIGFLLCLMMGF